MLEKWKLERAALCYGLLALVTLLSEGALLLVLAVTVAHRSGHLVVKAAQGLALGFGDVELPDSCQ